MGKRLFYLGLNSKPGNTVMCFVFMIFKSRISSWKIGLQVRRCVQGQTGWSNYGAFVFLNSFFCKFVGPTRISEFRIMNILSCYINNEEWLFPSVPHLSAMSRWKLSY